MFFIIILESLESFEYSDRKLKKKHSHTHSTIHNTLVTIIVTIVVDIECDNIQSGMLNTLQYICKYTAHTRKNSTIKTIGNEFLGDTRFDRLLLKYVVRLDFQIL